METVTRNPKKQKKHQLLFNRPLKQYLHVSTRSSLNNACFGNPLPRSITIPAPGPALEKRTLPKPCLFQVGLKLWLGE